MISMENSEEIDDVMEMATKKMALSFIEASQGENLVIDSDDDEIPDEILDQ